MVWNALKNNIGLRLWASIAVVIVVSVFLHIRFLEPERHLRDLASERGLQMARVLEGHVAPSMETDCGASFVREFGAYAADPSIFDFMIVRPDGQQAFSALDEVDPEIPRDVQTSFTPCQGCHLPDTFRGAKNVQHLDSEGEESRVLVAQTLGTIPGCQRCHEIDDAHRATLHLALAQPYTDLNHAAGRSQLIAAGIAVLLGTLIAAAAVVYAVVNRPLATLLDTVRRVESGDMSSRVPIKGEDDFGRIAGAFNSMTAKLEETHRLQRQTIEDQSRQIRARELQVHHQEKLAGLGTMATGVAHEIGNPLASISAVAQVLERKSGDAFTRSQTKLILDHIQRISRIVRDLSDFSRPALISLEDTSVNEIIETALNLLLHDPRFKGVIVEKDLARTNPEVMTIPDQLLQICFNLCLNAMEAMDGKGRLEVSSVSDGDCVTVRVHDSGPGVPEADHSRIFDPFFTTKPIGKGTGLGLSVSYGLAGSLGGELDLDPSVQSGAAFVLTIPIHAQPETQATLEAARIEMETIT